jgi:hypothetical protein
MFRQILNRRTFSPRPPSAAVQSYFQPAMAFFPPVDTKDATCVASFVTEKFSRMYPGAELAWLNKLFGDVQAFFEGKHPDYAAADLRYHDFEHTLQATACLTLLLEGRHASGVTPRLAVREFEMAISAVLLHDTGYLKLRSDKLGTGAKYTSYHVLRSCAFAASYLPTIGANDLEVEVVIGAISCTGPSKEINHVQFREPIGRVIGSALATADYLGQMAAADYPAKLESLFNEFRESDDFLHIPASRRVFNSAAELMARTPAFWEKFVSRKLEVDCQAMFRFLATPYPNGANPYLQAVEKNIAEIVRLTAAQPPIGVK